MRTQRLGIAPTTALSIAVILMLAPSVALGQACDPTDVFAPQVIYSAGDGSRSVAISDLDGDGHLDLAMANQNDGSVSVRLNNGDGTFAPQVRFSTGDQPLNVAIGDLNGDGHLDLVTANSSEGKISVLPNNGDGTFASQVRYGVGLGPETVAIGDLNDDGHLDLAVSNVLSNNLSVLLNNGDGTFALGVLYSVGIGPESVVICDLDGDGDADLAAANNISDNVSVLLNDGDGTFAEDVLYDVGDGPHSVVAGDLDGDGDNDLAVANTIGDSVSVLYNNCDGSLCCDVTFAPEARYGTRDRPISVAIGDLDGDGDLDLVVANNSSANISVLMNNTSEGEPGSFAPDAPFVAGNEPRSVALGDLNGDGNTDLAVANRLSNNVSVLQNQCATPPLITTHPAPVVLLPAGGGVAEFHVTASGTRPLAYQWQRDGVPLADGGRVSGATTSTLTIDATPEDVAAYDVVVSNPAGSDTSRPGVIAVRTDCRADIDGDGELTIFDFLAFQNAFAAGCP